MEYFLELEPDLAFPQEVVRLPSNVTSNYTIQESRQMHQLGSPRGSPRLSQFPANSSGSPARSGGEKPRLLLEEFVDVALAIQDAEWNLGDEKPFLPPEQIDWMKEHDHSYR